MCKEDIYALGMLEEELDACGHLDSCPCMVCRFALPALGVLMADGVGLKVGLG